MELKQANLDISTTYEQYVIDFDTETIESVITGTSTSTIPNIDFFFIQGGVIIFLLTIITLLLAININNPWKNLQ